MDLTEAQWEELKPLPAAKRRPSQFWSSDAALNRTKISDEEILP
jgi:hypothetical protein